MSSLTLWKVRTLVLHGSLLMAEALLWLGASLLIIEWHHHWGKPLDGRALSLIYLGLTGAFLYRVRHRWTRHQLLMHMEKGRPQDTPSPFMLQDVLEARGHFPDPDRLKELQDRLRKGKLPSYPLSFYGNHILKGLIWPFLITLLASATESFPSFYQHSNPLYIELTPPDYLNLPSRMVDTREEKIRVFPGTLIRISKLPASASLKDNQNRNYIPKIDTEGRSFNARILSPLTLKLSNPDHQLAVETLIDHPPSVQWTKTPVDLDFKPHSIAFKASDDHGLQETLVSVNDQEIEYAGDAQGRPQFTYRWDFDPTEHRPLLGGNVSLQISAYDNDRVGGPKKTLSSPIIWKFAGIQHLARQAIEKVQSTRDMTSKRVNPQESMSAEALLNEITEMSPLLRDNPAMSPALLGLNQSAVFQLTPHAQSNQAQPPTQEKNIHERHEWTLEMIEDQAQKILGTIEASKLVQRIQEMADKASREEVSHDEWNELYDDLQEHFKKTDTHPSFRDEMMKTFNQAELAAQMGDPETASDLLEKMAEQMRQQPSAMGASGSNPLAEMFKELLEELKDLINQQDENIGELSQNQNDLKDIHDFFQKLPQHPASKAYLEWRDEVTSISRQKGQIPKALQEKIGKQGDPVYMGRLLQQLHTNLSMVLTNRPPRLAWPQTAHLPQDLQNTWEELKPSVEALSGKAFSPKSLSTQKDVAERGQKFRQDFENNISHLLPGPNLGPIARQGEAQAQQASQRMSQGDHLRIVKQNMQRASSSWKSMLQQLERLQQAAQQAAGQQQQALRIGEDGKLQLSSQGQPQQEGDGRFDHQDHDIEIPLPEDFQSNKAIEERLQESLRKTRDEEEMSRFKDYMLDLLE